MAKPRDYKVGYGKPPEHSRFKTGQSGNPKGRPKGSKNVRQILADTLLAPVPVNANGKRKTMTAIEAFATTIRNNALKGDLKAAQILLRLMPYIAGGASAEGNDVGPAAPADDAAAYAALQQDIYDLLRADPDRGITLADGPDAADTPAGDGRT